MATVYRATDARLGVPRAIKVLDPTLARRASLRARFENEARTLAKLRHRHIVPVLDLGVDGDDLFLVMELASGGCVGDRLDTSGALRPGLACDVAIAVLDALQHAHDHGVVHRDVKPQNVLIGADGTPMLGDFGIAHASDVGLTRTGMAMGTQAYMSPEQRMSPRSVDGRSDVYSAGVMLHVLLTAREPDWHNVSPQDGVREVAGVDPVLGDVVRVATRWTPAERWPSAAAMRDALVAARARFPPEPPGALRRTSGAGDDGSDALADVDGGEWDNHDAAGGSDPFGQRSDTVTYGRGSEPRRSAVPNGARWMAVCTAFLAAALIGAAALASAAGLAAAHFASTRDGVQVHAGAAAIVAPARGPAPVAAEDTPSLSGSAIGSEASSRAPSGAVLGRAPARGPTPAPSASKVSPPAEAASVGPPATLVLNSVPWSTVEVDGVIRGPTAWTGQVAAGAHRVRFTDASGRSAWRSYEVPAGGTIRDCWDFRSEAPCTR